MYCVGVMPKTPRRGADGRGGARGRARGRALGRAARGRAARGHSRGEASVAASSTSTSTSGSVTLVHWSLSAGPSRSSATVTSASGTPGHPLVVGDLVVTDLLQLICYEVRQSSLAISSPPLTLPTAQSTELTASTGLSGQGPEVPGELCVRVGGMYLWCLSRSQSCCLCLECMGRCDNSLVKLWNYKFVLSVSSSAWLFSCTFICVCVCVCVRSFGGRSISTPNAILPSRSMILS